jgi:hypothetical protein
MPFDISKYPPEWKAISRECRERAGYRCEWCRAPHGVVVTRAPKGFYSTIEQDDEDSTEETVWRNSRGQQVSIYDIAEALETGFEFGPEGQLLPDCKLWQSKVILTAAHTEETGGSKHDKSNLHGLRALCNSCHLRYDLSDHIAHARETRMRRRAVGSLFAEGDND